ncbi:MAG: hypothetical protein E6R03_16090 [Hyphomicrobiaceae bacterium]|nr:MAG: hypothetical protein E6R03_16090 [Hyphomicrobiaceae bacterium]
MRAILILLLLLVSFPGYIHAQEAAPVPAEENSTVSTFTPFERIAADRLMYLSQSIDLALRNAQLQHELQQTQLMVQVNGLIADIEKAHPGKTLKYTEQGPQLVDKPTNGSPKATVKASPDTPPA